MDSLAITYMDQKKYDDALSMFRDCLAKRKAVLGEANSRTLDTMKNLGIIIIIIILIIIVVVVIITIIVIATARRMSS